MARWAFIFAAAFVLVAAACGSGGGKTTAASVAGMVSELQHALNIHPASKTYGLHWQCSVNQKDTSLIDCYGNGNQGQPGLFTYKEQPNGGWKAVNYDKSQWFDTITPGQLGFGNPQ